MTIDGGVLTWGLTKNGWASLYLQGSTIKPQGKYTGPATCVTLIAEMRPHGLRMINTEERAEKCYIRYLH